MVTEFGMSDKLGPRTFGHKEELIFLGREITEQRNYSEKVAQEIDGEVHNIIQHAYKLAKKILTENKPKLIYIAEQLIAHESLEGEELDSLLTKPIPSPQPQATATPAPTPAKTTTTTKRMPKKAPIIPQPIPKQAPAAPDLA